MGMTRAPRRAMLDERRALYLLLAIGTLGVVAVAYPYLGVIVVSAWFGHLARPLLAVVARAVGGRRRAAALLTVALVLVLLTPLVVIVTVSVSTAASLFQRLQGTALGEHWLELFRTSAQQGTLRAAQMIGAGASHAVLAFALFLVGAYTCLLDGERAWAWFVARTPLREPQMQRLADAFHRCGSGLLIGGVLTSAAQGLVGTIVYALLGLPHPIVLGGLTFLAAFVPLLGTSTVWVPAAIGLALEGRPLASGALVVFGVLLIGTVDNMMRPYFARFGRLDLPMWVLALSMFGGIALFGFQGLVLGPVIVRLTMEILAIVGDDAVARKAEASCEKPGSGRPSGSSLRTSSSDLTS